MIKVALIGAGFMGQTHLDRYKNNKNCALTYVFDASLERAQKLSLPSGCKATDSLDEVLQSDVDMVDICLPTFLHMEYCKKSAAAGKHVMCEKPMSIQTAQCKEMIDTCAENGVQLMIAHVLRFWPEYMFIQKAKADGRFGKLLYIRSGRRQAMPNWSFQNWLSNPELSLGGVVDAQIHDLDFAISLLGMPERISAAGVKSVYGGWEQATTLLHAKDGTVFCSEVCNLMPAGYPFTAQLCAVFERASIDYNSTLEQTVTVYEEGKEPYHPQLPAQDGYQNEIDYFIDCISTGKAVSIGTGQDGLNALRLSLAAKTALDTGKEVVL